MFNESSMNTHAQHKLNDNEQRPPITDYNPNSKLSLFFMIILLRMIIITIIRCNNYLSKWYTINDENETILINRLYINILSNKMQKVSPYLGGRLSQIHDISIQEWECRQNSYNFKHNIEMETAEKVANKFLFFCSDESVIMFYHFINAIALVRSNNCIYCGLFYIRFFHHKTAFYCVKFLRFVLRLWSI